MQMDAIGFETNTVRSVGISRKVVSSNNSRQVVSEHEVVVFMNRSTQTVFYWQAAIIALPRRHCPVAVLKVLPSDGHHVVPQQLPEGLLAVRAGLALIRDADGRRSGGRRLEGRWGCARSAGGTLGRGQEEGAGQQDAEEKKTRPTMAEATMRTHEVRHTRHVSSVRNLTCYLPESGNRVESSNHTATTTQNFTAVKSDQLRVLANSHLPDQA